MNHGERKARLEALLLSCQDLWRPQPFKHETPVWCANYPALTEQLLDLDGDAAERLAADNTALIDLLSGHVPETGNLVELIDLGADCTPTVHSPPSTEPDRLFADVPGRKRRQIEAYASALGEPRAEVLEWCSGKGHLGRLLARRWQKQVTSLEIDPALCDAGEALARRAGLDHRQGFLRKDALAADSSRHLASRHPVALHACGDLHTRLVANAVASGSPAVSVAPCCFYRIAADVYQPFNPSPLMLSRDDLRLAVTETVTASPMERQRSRRTLAWKLGWVELRKAATGEADYRSFPPVPEPWLRSSFAEFVQRMAERELLNLAGLDLGRFEARGQARASRMLRLQPARLAFRRPLEVWLVMDMAVFLENNGYRVDVRPFCEPGLTPRNLLLSARRM